MKKFTLSIVVCLFSLYAMAQDCMPTEGLPDTLVGVVPLPFDAESNPEGGINDTACLNQAFEFTFTIVVPPEFESPIGPVPVNSIEFATEGAVTNIPAVFDYICSPPDCIFPRDSTGCVKLFGTVTDAADVDVWDMQIAGTIRSVIDFELTFPSELFPGNYFLHVQAEDSPFCSTVSAEETLTEITGMKNIPNPFSGITQIQIDAVKSGNYELTIFDMMGRAVENRAVFIGEGRNTIEFDAGNLADGLYLYTLGNEYGSISEKMLISRR